MRLRECPFCGAEVQPRKGKDRFGDHWVIQCLKCRLKIIRDTQIDVINAWNRRPVHDTAKICDDCGGRMNPLAPEERD